MKKNSFIEGAFIATIAIIFVKILGMLYVIPFYKIIGEGGGSLYSYSYNIYMTFLGISSAGIPSAISKIISEYDTLGYKEAKYRAYKLGIKLVSYISIAAFLIMFIFANVIGKLIIGKVNGINSVSDVAFVIRCISFAILVIPYLSVTKGYIQGHRIVTPSSVANIIEQVVRIAVVLGGSYYFMRISGSTRAAVGAAVTGAFFGGLFAYLYLRHQMNKNKDKLEIREYKVKDDIKSLDIIKKILSYAFPFIIINIATNIYNFIDMILILRGLPLVGFSGAEAEYIQSAINTWSTKICMIISAFSMGMSYSLIPNIVRSYVKKDWNGVENKLNKAIQIILIISIPCVIGINILAVPIWNIFYGPSIYGPTILKILLISTLFSNIYLICLDTMQGLNKYKIVYRAVFTGFIINAILDIPFMFLLKYIGLPAYWGSSFATITGFIVSIKIATINLKVNNNIKFKSTYKVFGKILIPSILMCVSLVLFNYLIKWNYTSKKICILAIICNAIIGASIYLFTSHKLGLIEFVFGKEFIKKIKNKIVNILNKLKRK